MKKTLSFAMAIATALSCTSFAAADYAYDVPEECGTSYVEEQSNKELETALRYVKSRISIPSDLTEFYYSTSLNNNKTVYSFNWSTPYTADSYREINCSICSTVITYYNYYDGSKSYKNEINLAKLSADELYTYAQKSVQKLNPTVYKDICIEKDTLSISRNRNRATFQVVRTKNGVPVANDRGNIVIDKDTGELISYNINWHTKAAFKKPDNVISEEKAQKAYADMIDIYPVYQLTYDREKDEYISDIIYMQNNYGEINAFTGKKSDFEADGYYDETMESDDCIEEEGNPSTGADKNFFTEQELEEINKELPYSSEEKIRELVDSKDYFILTDDMELYYFTLYKQTEGKTDQYFYTASFSSADYDKDSYWNDEFEETVITVNAESGEIISYNYYKNKATKPSNTYDEAAAEQKAIDIAKELAGDKFKEYGDINTYLDYYKPMNGNITNYYGSSHIFNRYVNDIEVSGDWITVDFNSDNVLTSYYINYTEADFVSPDKMLSEDEIMNIFWQNNDIELYYLARVNEKKTKTVLVYGTDEAVYCNAFTGEQLYYYTSRSDLSGIKTAEVKEMAQILNNHNILISSTPFLETDAVKQSDYIRIMNYISSVGIYSNDLPVLSDGRIYEYEDDAPITNSDAMILFTAAECGNKVPQLKGIYRSPYTDVKDSDANVGYYAIAHALLDSKATELHPDEAFTYADMIKQIYNYLA